MLTDGQATEKLIIQCSKCFIFTRTNKRMNRLTPWGRALLEKLIIFQIVKKHGNYVEKWLSCAPSPCFMPFCYNISCQFTPLNLRYFIFGLTPFGWLHSSMLTPYFSWGYDFLCAPSSFMPSFSGMQLGHKTRAGCIVTFQSI
jgi:hypothetical protein